MLTKSSQRLDLRFLQLTGVLTHKGNAADGGHYVTWIRKDDGTWYLFDDDKVSVSIPRAGRPVCVCEVVTLFRACFSGWTTQYMALVLRH